MRASSLVALVAGYTGWTLEYIGELSYAKLRCLYNEITYQRLQEQRQADLMIAQLIAMWASGKATPEQLVGKEPTKPQEVTNMTRTLAPQTVVLGDGKEYVLPVINANIMELIEDDLDQDWAGIWENLRAKQLKVIVRHLLRCQNPNITLDEVGELLTTDAINNVAKILPKLV